MLVLLLTLLLVLMLLPIVLKDTHLDALIQQHLRSHVALTHLLTQLLVWPLRRPVLLLLLHPVTRVLVWWAHQVGCVWYLYWRVSWGPPHLHVAYWLPHVETAERLRRVLRCACGAPMFSANRISAHPILEWGTWVLLTILTIAWWCHRWLFEKSAPMRWGRTWPHRFQACLELLCFFLCFRASEHRFQPFALRSPSRWIGT